MQLPEGAFSTSNEITLNPNPSRPCRLARALWWPFSRPTLKTRDTSPASVKGFDIYCKGVAHRYSSSSMTSHNNRTVDDVFLQPLLDAIERYKTGSTGLLNT